MSVDRPTPVELNNRLQQWTMGVNSSAQWTLAVIKACAADWLASHFKGPARWPSTCRLWVPDPSGKQEAAGRTGRLKAHCCAARTMP
jgi:hypothetical protein